MADDLVYCKEERCTEEAVSGGSYCEDHLLEQQVRAVAPSPVGTLAQMIRNAKAHGYIPSIRSGSAF